MRNFTDNFANLNGQFKFLVWGVFQHINPPTSAMSRENAEVIIFEDSRRAPEAAPMGSVRTSEEPKRPIMTAQPNLLGPLIPSNTTPVKVVLPDFPFFSYEELDQPFLIAQPNLFDVQSPAESSSRTTSSPGIATLEKSTAKQMRTETEETAEQKLAEAKTKASQRGFFGPPSQDITTPGKRTTEEHMQATKAIRDRGGSGVPFKLGIGLPSAEVVNPIAVPGSVPPTPLQMHLHAKKSKSRDFPTAYTIVKKICAAALAAAGTSAIQCEEAVRVIYN